MKHEVVRSRKPVNLSLDVQIVSEAKALGINISKACENGLVSALQRERERAWLEENMAALQSSNDWVEKHGLPLAKFRKF